MALVSAISISVVDDRGKSESVNVFVPNDATLAEIQALSNLLVAALEDITGGYVAGASVQVGLSLPAGTRTTAAADAFNTVGANLGFDAANTVYRQTIRVPAILPTLVSGGEVIDDAPLLTAFTGLIVAGDGTTNPTNKFGDDLTGFMGASMSFRTK